MLQPTERSAKLVMRQSRQCEMTVVQYYGVRARCSNVFSENGNADIPMWCRHVKTAEIRSVVLDNDISAESDMPCSYLKVDELCFLSPYVVGPPSFCSNACGGRCIPVGVSKFGM